MLLFIASMVGLTDSKEGGCFSVSKGFLRGSKAGFEGSKRDFRGSKSGFVDSKSNAGLEREAPS